MIKENVVDNWGSALKNIAVEFDLVDRFLVEGNSIIDLLKEHEDLVKLLSVRNLEFEPVKIKIIDEVFAKNGVNQYFVNTMKILVEEKIFYYLRAILKNLRKKLVSMQNIIYGVAWSAVPLTDQQLKKMEVKMTTRFQREVILVNKLDPNLLGGVQLIVDNHIIDGSIKGKLDQLRQSTLKGK